MRFHFLFSFFLISNAAIAADQKPGILPPNQFAAGWVSLFDGETTFGWTGGNQADIKDGKWQIGQEKHEILKPNVHLGKSWELQFELAGGMIRLADRTLFIDSKPQKGNEFSKILIKYDASKKTVIDGNGYHEIPIHKPGKELESLPFLIEADAKNPCTIHSIKMRPTNLESIFNGKDLTGWKKYTGDPKREKSQFEVTPQGELHLTNGPGDLQTEKQFDDFCLQLECKTNGKHLNSGIFFRCLPGEYQQGYEAQIHNGFLENNRAKPTDFGTGAIYRRIQSRYIVPNDQEWFAMTILAVGPRLSTWVNGYPTADWVDERPKNKNGRNGLKLDAGPISIQGHDPTTDILFRNIRITAITQSKSTP